MMADEQQGAEQKQQGARPAPAWQPEVPREPFGTDEPLWWDNGIWGEAGYAIANPGGKTWSKNTVVTGLVRFMGRELFALMHQPDVRFTRPPNKEFLFEVNKMIRLGMKRTADRSIGFNDERLDGVHATSTPGVFVVYPVPFFGERIRQANVREWCHIILLTLSEVMQHSDNDYDADITDFLTSVVHERLHRIQYLLATTFLGVDRDTAIADDYRIPDEAFAGDAYKPESLFTNSEMVEERHPLRWWPTENDLSKIRAIPITEAMVYARRWPDSQLALGGDGGSETGFPGGGGPRVGEPSFVRSPGSAPK